MPDHNEAIERAHLALDALDYANHLGLLGANREHILRELVEEVLDDGVLDVDEMEASFEGIRRVIDAVE